MAVADFTWKNSGYERVQGGPPPHLGRRAHRILIKIADVKSFNPTRKESTYCHDDEMSDTCCHRSCVENKIHGKPQSQALGD